MLIHVRLFAALREAAGAPELTVALGDGGEAPPTAADVWSALERRCAALAPFAARGLAVAIDRRVVPLSTPVSAGAEVAFLPPISGG